MGRHKLRPTCGNQVVRDQGKPETASGYRALYSADYRERQAGELRNHAFGHSQFVIDQSRQRIARGHHFFDVTSATEHPALTAQQ